MGVISLHPKPCIIAVIKNACHSDYQLGKNKIHLRFEGSISCERWLMTDQKIVHIVCFFQVAIKIYYL